MIDLIPIQFSATAPSSDNKVSKAACVSADGAGIGCIVITTLEFTLIVILTCVEPPTVGATPVMGISVVPIGKVC